ncbi:MAG: hypothetical protein ABI949_04485 [Ilumatobacteraceae bacterium]
MSDHAAIKTYRLLRLGIVGVVGLLTVSVAFERSKVACWQPSISAYYYTPVRVIFVGGLMTIGLCLIVIRGSTTVEDACLNVAGMLAPVVAVVPIADAGGCWSVQPRPIPTNPDGTLAAWVVANIDNNMKALLLAGIAGIVTTSIIATIATRNALAVAQAGVLGTRLSLLGAFALLVAGAIAFHSWADFDTQVHFIAAIIMFAFLAIAVATNAWGGRRSPVKVWYFRLYAAIAVLMVVAAATMLPFEYRWRHADLVLEGTEISLFAAFWLAQTAHHWNEIN